MLTEKQKEAEIIKKRQARQQEIDDHKAFIGKNNKKQYTPLGTQPHRLPSFKF